MCFSALFSTTYIQASTSDKGTLPVVVSNTVKSRCNERQYNEMFRIVKLFLGPFPFPYLMCVKTFHFNEFRTFNITKYSNDMAAIFHTCTWLVEHDIDLKVTSKLCTSSNARGHAIGWVGSQSLQSTNERYNFVSLTYYPIWFIHVASRVDCLSFIRKATCLLVCLLTLYHRQYG